MEKLLLTGFGPFGPHPTNVTEEAVRRLDGTELEGFTIVARTLPVQFEQAVAELEAALAEERPSAVLAAGIHGEADGYRVELTAKNLRDYELPDVAGEVVKGQPVVTGGPPMAFGQLPVGAIKAALEAEGLETALSEDAGSYLCNAVYFWLCQRDAPAGFLHVPAGAAETEAAGALRAALGAIAHRLAAQRIEATA